MNRMAQVGLLLALVGWTGISAAEGAEEESQPPLVERYLISGELQEGEEALVEHLEENAEDNEVRFGLGVLRLLKTVEQFSQSLHKYGFQPQFNQLPFLRLPVPPNSDPQPVDYEKLRQVYVTLLKDLERVEETLAKVQDEKVKLPLHIGRIRLDLNGDGRAEENETFWKIYSRLNRRADVSTEQAEKYLIAFDLADVYWLRGYCHLLMAFDEFILAYDWEEAFNRTAHWFFKRPETPYSYLTDQPDKQNEQLMENIADAIAFIHMIRFPVEEAKRMESALKHLESMIAFSRKSWQAIEAEEDDDREWIPGADQTGVIPGVRVTEQMVDSWKIFLAEAEAILKGEKLVPHWRVKDGRGINFRRIFTEPTQFDLVLWIQGTSAAPYLEEGEMTSPETWQRLQRTFQGQFIGFAIWFN